MRRGVWGRWIGRGKLKKMADEEGARGGESVRRE
jgi:hypothetical protein